MKTCSGPLIAGKPDATYDELKKIANADANEASPAALPRKFDQPHIYEHNGAYFSGTT
jgi:hypothetical protein